MSLFKKISVFFSTMAVIVGLVIGALQLEMVNDFIFEPKITVDVHPAFGVPVSGAFIIRNEGRGTAEDVEIGIIAGKNSVVKVVPISANITHDDGDPVRNFRIVIPYMNKDGSVIVSTILKQEEGSEPFVMPKIDPNDEEAINEFLKNEENSREFLLNLPPSVSHIRSKEGSGVFKYDAS